MSSPQLTVAALSLAVSLSLSLLPLHSVMLWPNFAFNYIKFSYVTLLPLPGQSSCLHLMPTADTGLQGWLNRNYTHLAPGHCSTRTMHKAATVPLSTSTTSALCLYRFFVRKRSQNVSVILGKALSNFIINIYILLISFNPNIRGQVRCAYVAKLFSEMLKRALDELS